AHSHLEGDTSFLRQDRDGAVQFCEVAQLVEDRADGRWLSFEMGSERITAARMRLIAICKLPFAVRASPHRVCRANHIKLCIVVATAVWAVSPERPTGAWLHATAAIKTRVMPEPTAIIDIGREREKRKILPIHIVLQIKHPRETGAGNLRFIPRAIGSLRRQQIAETTLHTWPI